MIRVLLQATAGSTERQIYDESTLTHLETRSVAAPHPYPYGFVIGTTAADGGCVDCYLITPDRPPVGAIVECEPIGLLCQDENGEPDHKILATPAGCEVTLPADLLLELESFITTLFAAFPGAQVRVGPILSRAAALDYLRESQ